MAGTVDPSPPEARARAPRKNKQDTKPGSFRKLRQTIMRKADLYHRQTGHKIALFFYDKSKQYTVYSSARKPRAIPGSSESRRGPPEFPLPLRDIRRLDPPPAIWHAEDVKDLPYRQRFVMKYKPTGPQVEPSAPDQPTQDVVQLAHQILAATNQAALPARVAQLVYLLQQPSQPSSSPFRPEHLATALQDTAPQTPTAFSQANTALMPEDPHTSDGRGDAPQLLQQTPDRICADNSSQSAAESGTLSLQRIYDEYSSDNTDSENEGPEDNDGEDDDDKDDDGEDDDGEDDGSDGDPDGIFSIASRYTPGANDFATITRKLQLASAQTPEDKPAKAAYLLNTPPTSLCRTESELSSTPVVPCTPTRQPRPMEGLGWTTRTSVASQSECGSLDESDILMGDLQSDCSPPGPPECSIPQDCEAVTRETDRPTPSRKSRPSSARKHVSHGKTVQNRSEHRVSSQRTNRPMDFYIEIPTLASYRKATRVAKQGQGPTNGKTRLSRQARGHFQSSSASSNSTG